MPKTIEIIHDPFDPFESISSYQCFNAFLRKKQYDHDNLFVYTTDGYLYITNRYDYDICCNKSKCYKLKPLKHNSFRIQATIFQYTTDDNTKKVFSTSEYNRSKQILYLDWKEMTETLIFVLHGPMPGYISIQNGMPSENMSVNESSECTKSVPFYT
jgi:hypothetical protein